MDDNHESFLRAISQNESSGGQNTDHAVISSGPDKGLKAVGQYGLTPSTLDTLINSRARHNHFGPDENILGQLDNDQLKDFIQDNPRVEQTYAQQNANRLFKKSDGDSDKAAVMWNKGPNVDPSELTPEAMDENPYVQKFRKVSNMLESNN